MPSKVLIIVPAFNEGESIMRVVAEIRASNPRYQILVINDGSRDDTGYKASLSEALVVHHPFNMGIGGAVQTGFKFAHQNKFDIAVQVDGDGQHDPKYIMKIIQPLLEDNLDFCIGSRFLLRRSLFTSTWFRRIGIRFFSMLLSCVTGIRLTDPTSGFRALNKQMISIFSEHYPIDFPEPESIQIAKRLGARIGEVPVRMRKRMGGQSSIRHLSTLYYMIKVTLAILIDTLRSNKPSRRPL